MDAPQNDLIIFHFIIEIYGSQTGTLVSNGDWVVQAIKSLKRSFSFKFKCGAPQINIFK